MHGATLLSVWLHASDCDARRMRACARCSIFSQFSFTPLLISDDDDDISRRPPVLPVHSRSRSTDLAGAGLVTAGRRRAVRAAFHDTDTDIVARMSSCRATSPVSLPQELLQEIARVGRKDVGVSGESVSWNWDFTAV